MLLCILPWCPFAFCIYHVCESSLCFVLLRKAEAMHSAGFSHLTESVLVFQQGWEQAERFWGVLNPMDHSRLGAAGLLWYWCQWLFTTSGSETFPSSSVQGQEYFYSSTAHSFCDKYLFSLCQVSVPSLLFLLSCMDVSKGYWRNIYH